jgi:CubicO group peptidase (beta-lactamase class C family)
VVLAVLAAATGCRSQQPAKVEALTPTTEATAAADSAQQPAPPASATPPLTARDAALARAKALELDTPYVPPPGDPLEYSSAAFAKVVCSAVFISGFSAEFAAENLGYFTSPYAERARLGKPVVDRAARTVSVRSQNGVTRVAKYFDSQGCVGLPAGQTDVRFEPVVVKSKLPDAAKQPWPMGDLLPKDPLPQELDARKLEAAADAAFAPAAMTAALVVTWRGRLILERYGENVSLHTPLAGWSMGKSVIATLMGVLIQAGVYRLEQPAPIPQWQAPGDPRRTITIANLLNMSSGLRMRAPQDPDYDASGPYPDHLYLYTGDDSVAHAASRPLQWPPGTVGRYHNIDPVLVNYLVRLAAEQRGENPLTFPQRALFDQLGIRSAVLEPDPQGNLLAQGYDFMSGRDWARLGNLYLQGGTFAGRRILPQSYVEFVRTAAPAWKEDGQPVYGGFFWLNLAQQLPLPPDTYYMSGAGGQVTLIMPSHDLVVVRLGHDKGEDAMGTSLGQAMPLLLEAVPRH